jgi:hypothetical protein
MVKAVRLAGGTSQCNDHCTKDLSRLVIYRNTAIYRCLRGYQGGDSRGYRYTVIIAISEIVVPSFDCTCMELREREERRTEVRGAWARTEPL